MQHNTRSVRGHRARAATAPTWCALSPSTASRKQAPIQDWFAKRPRWHRHLTPTSSSWLNQVERFLPLLTEQQIKRGAHRSTAELEAAIERYIETHNRNPRPFRWTKSAGHILASIERFCQTSLSVHDNVEPAYP